jgi:hypothetical protein
MLFLSPSQLTKKNLVFLCCLSSNKAFLLQGEVVVFTIKATDSKKSSIDKQHLEMETTTNCNG